MFLGKGGKGYVGVLCEIHVPKGSNAVYLKGVGECELLLDRGAMFRVDHVETHGDLKIVRMSLTYQGITFKDDRRGRDRPGVRVGESTNSEGIDISRFVWGSDDVTAVDPTALPEAKDASGHEHKGKGEGGGQYTGGGGGGGGGGELVGHSRPNSLLPAEARPALTKQQARAVKLYTGDDYDDVNGALRAGKAPEGRAGKVHAELQGALAGVKPFAEPVTAYRGLSFPQGDNDGKGFLAKLAEAKEGGKALQFGGYLSTTTNAGVARKFASDVTMEIAARRGLDVQSHSDSPAENELLMDHNSLFTVDSYEKQGNKWHVKLKQVPS